MNNLKNIKKELQEIQDLREKAIKIEREIVPICAQAIRDIQKNKYNEAGVKISRIREKINKCEKILNGHPEIIVNILGPAYQEYAELAIFLSYIKKRKLPKLNIPAKFYLLGLGDAIGELKRVCVEYLAEGRIDEAEKLADKLEDLYFELSQHVYPNAIVPGLKRKQDIARKVLNALYNQIITHKLMRPKE